VHAVVNFRVRELTIALERHVIAICKCPINPITKPNLVLVTPWRDSMSKFEAK
jgi:hypothetical protein